ncbi:regulatory protein, luxR family [Amycolatopsis xylanica]|uniref:Regulatory protein, luxR family n=1 Tax=Amycolatopsis xylanica TaxID=589385 RepID=A0A1H2S0B6_9PSEU|nr:regulatory protein, luxR family [Amycolatopsis xylanica]
MYVTVGTRKSFTRRPRRPTLATVDLAEVTQGRRLHGRDRELDLLAAHLERIGAGEPAVVTLTGAAGTGKTSLLTAAAELAEAQGFLVLSARAAKAERDFAFGVVRQLLERTLPLPLDHDDIQAQLHGWWLWLSAHLAEHFPVLLLVDDAELADPQSTRWLGYAARRLAAGHRIGILLTRSTDTPAGDSPPFHRLPLRGLDRQACELVITDSLGGDLCPAFVETCQVVSAGNPARLTALIRTCLEIRASRLDLAVFGTPRLSEAVHRFLAEEDPALASLARTVAALDDAPIDLDLAAAVAGLTPSSALRAAKRLRELRFLTGARKPAFADRGVRVAIASGLSPAECQAAHAKAARVLRREQAPDRLVAAHLRKTDEIGEAWVTEVLLDAAGTALADGDPHEAVAHLRRVLREPLPPERREAVLFELGAAEVHADPAAAVRTLTRVVENDGEPARRARATELLSDALWLSGRWNEALNVLREAVRFWSVSHPRLAADLEVCVLYQSRHDPQAAVAIPRRLAALGHTSEAGTRRLNAFLAARGSVTGQPVAAVRRLALENGPTGPITGLGELRAFGAVVTALTNIEEYDLALLLCDKVLDDGASGLPLATGLALLNRAEIHYQRGELTSAGADLEAAADKLSLVDIKGELLDGARMRLVAARGDQAEIERLLARKRTTTTYLRACLTLHARGLLHAAAGDHASALADQLDCGRRLAHLGLTEHPQAPWRIAAALAHFELGNHEEALALAESELASARERNLPRRLGVALRVAGTVRDSPALLIEAVEVLGRSQARLELANAQASLKRTEPDQALTERERDVATLARKGWSNPEIAAALVLSRRTVEFHLTNIYRKLDISRRGQLAHKLPAKTG